MEEFAELDSVLTWWRGGLLTKKYAYDHGLEFLEGEVDFVLEHPTVIV